MKNGRGNVSNLIIDHSSYVRLNLFEKWRRAGPILRKRRPIMALWFDGLWPRPSPSPFIIDSKYPSFPNQCEPRYWYFLDPIFAVVFHERNEHDLSVLELYLFETASGFCTPNKATRLSLWNISHPKCYSRWAWGIFFWVSPGSRLRRAHFNAGNGLRRKKMARPTSFG